MSKSKTTYTSADIETLEGLDAVRKRPAMYIGGTDEQGLHHLLWEVMDNSIDEASSGHCDKITIALGKNGSVEVSDNGRGIPVGEHSNGKSALEVVLSTLHSGGKFKEGAYQTAGGLHGVGVAVVNALSSSLQATVDRDGKRWKIKFQNQKVVSELAESGKANGTGTNIKFTPDYEEFSPEASFDYERICDRANKKAFLIPGLKISIVDKREGEAKKFNAYHKGGIKDFLFEKANGSKIINKSSVFSIEKKIPYTDAKDKKRELLVSASLIFTDTYDKSNLHSFANTIETPNGGSHLNGFVSAIVSTCNNTWIATSKQLAGERKKGNGKAKEEDIFEGAIGSIHVSFPDPEFRGQTKEELGSDFVKKMVRDITIKEFTKWCSGSKQPEVKEKIINAILAREASRMARDEKRKNKGSSGSTLKMPAKLADCQTHGEDAELILVEGDSAAGPAKEGRDPKIMAILPLRGKIINAVKVSRSKALENTEVLSILQSLGSGWGEAYDASKLRYGRIIILCDADVDGKHIRTLLLALIFTFLKPMLEEGRVFLAQPPLFSTRDKKGNIFRAYSEEDVTRIEKKEKLPKDALWQRFKGLGEMNTRELAYCALDTNTRTLIRIEPEDGENAYKEANSMIRKWLSDDTDSKESRKEFLMGSSSSA